MKKITIIAAVSEDGVLGLDNKIPWSCPEDMAHFKKTTANSVVIMGRKTFESMGSKLLPKRTNILVSPSLLDNSLSSLKTKESLSKELIITDSLKNAIANAREQNKPIFIIGGASLYNEGMKFADEILLSVIPTTVNNRNAVNFPFVSPLTFKVTSIEDKETFKLITYHR